MELKHKRLNRVYKRLIAKLGLKNKRTVSKLENMFKELDRFFEHAPYIAKLTKIKITYGQLYVHYLNTDRSNVICLTLTLPENDHFPVIISRFREPRTTRSTSYTEDFILSRDKLYRVLISKIKYRRVRELLKGEEICKELGIIDDGIIKGPGYFIIPASKTSAIMYKPPYFLLISSDRAKSETFSTMVRVSILDDNRKSSKKPWMSRCNLVSVIDFLNGNGN